MLGSLLGFVLSLMRVGRSRALRIVSTAYVEFFRGTPVLVQLFWIFFCLPIVLHVDSAIRVLGDRAHPVHGRDRLGELPLGAARDPKGPHRRRHGARAFAHQRARYIVFPQAIRLAIPTLLSNSVSLFKESSLVSAVGMSDLMYVGQNVSNISARPIELLTTVAFLYFAIAFPLTRAVSHLESRMLRTVGT